MFVGKGPFKYYISMFLAFLAKLGLKSTSSVVGLKLMKLNYLSVGIQFRIVCKMVKIGVF